MAEIRRGILGGFSGRVGNVVGSSWKGKDIMRALPTSVTNPKTAGQQSQRAKFGIAVKFVSANLAAVNEGFKSQSKGMSAANAAMAYNLKNAVQGDYPQQVLDFSKVQLSRGTLAAPAAVTLLAEENHALTLNWSTSGVTGNPSVNDKLMVSLYNSQTGEAAWYEECATREEGTSMLETPQEWSGQNAEVFCFFVSALPSSELRTTARVSKTTFGGSVELT